MITEELIEEFVSVEDKAKHVKDPLVFPKSMLFNCEGEQDTLDVLNGTYDFESPGQITEWAKRTQRMSIQLEAMITRVVHRLWRSKYDIFKDRKTSIHVMNAMGFDSTMLGHEITKVLQVLYPDDVSLPVQDKVTHPITNYLKSYHQTIVPQLLTNIDLYKSELRTANLSVMNFHPVFVDLSDDITGNNPFLTTMVVKDISYLPIFSFGLAIGNELRVFNNILEKLIAGDMKYLKANQKEIRDILSIILNACSYMSLEGLFFITLTRSVMGGDDYTDHMHYNDKEYKDEDYDKWLDLTLPFGAWCTAETQYSLMHN